MMLMDQTDPNKQSIDMEFNSPCFELLPQESAREQPSHLHPLN
jgi:hypothetical protein